jgi:hypothetical protein
MLFLVTAMGTRNVSRHSLFDEDGIRPHFLNVVVVYEELGQWTMDEVEISAHRICVASSSDKFLI